MMLRQLIGGDTANFLSMAFTEWRRQMASQQESELRCQLARQKEEGEQAVAAAQTQALDEASKREAELRAKAHATSEMMLRQLIGGDTASSLSMAFTEWRQQMASQQKSELRCQLARQKEEGEQALAAAQTQAVDEAGKREAELRAKAHAKSEMMLRQLIGGDTASSLSMAFTEWRQQMASQQKSELRCQL